MNGVRPRGIALITALVVCVLLLIMLMTLFGVIRGGSLSAKRNSDATAALYVAEAGVAEAVARLSADPAFASDFSGALLDGKGTYSVTFGPSVNNVSGAGSVAGPRGPGTVPANTADIVVVAQVGLARRELEVLISPTNLAIDLDTAALVSGRILLSGDVEVDGIASLADPTGVAVGVHSNDSSNNDEIIVWKGNVGDTAEVSGTVGVAGSGANAIDFTTYSAGTANLGASQSSAGQKSFPAIDVSGRVAAQSGGAPPPTDGTALSGQSFYNSGDLTIAGDLVLQDDAELYVDGNLTVLGSISGTGSVYVNGETDFRGDSQITARKDTRTALYSKGSVRLTGFDGTAYLETVAAADPTTQAVYDETKYALNTLQNLIQGHIDAGTLDQILTGGADKATVDDMRRSLSQEDGPFYFTTPALLKKLRLAVEAEPAGPTRDFMAKRLNDVQGFFQGHGRDNSGFAGTSTFDMASTLAAWNSGQPVYGIFDAVIDSGDAGLIGTMAAYIDSIDYDRLGTSYFQGLVYTNGFLYASNEVEVVGAVVCRDDGSQAPQSIGSDTVKPGDLVLADNCKLTFVEDFFQDSGSGQSAGGQVGVWAWLGK